MYKKENYISKIENVGGIMRNWVALFSFFILFVNAISQQSPLIYHLDPYNPEYAPNVVLVKFKDEVDLQKSFLQKGTNKTGIPSIDKLNQSIEIESIEKVFKGKRKPLPKRLFKDAAGNIHEVPSLDKIYKIKYKATIDAKDVSKMFAEDPNVEYAEPDYYFYILGWPADRDDNAPYTRLYKAGETYPDDPLYQSGDQWYLDAVNAPAAWDSTTGDTTQIIGIIDTGVDWHHPDLDDNIWVNKAELDGIPGVDDDGNGFVDDIRGWDFVNNDNDPMDDNSHGTHVAGIAAAEGNNGVGIAGVVWNAKIMSVKVLQSSGRGRSSDLAAGIDYAVQNGATVINMSLGSYGESLTVKHALENAYAYAILVAAAGNDGYCLVQEGIPPGNMYPACYPFVLGVQASNLSEVRAGFSNIDPSGPVEFRNQWGYNYEMMAPGVTIISTIPNSGYRVYNGTSMSAPLVSGAVAILKSANPELSNEKIFAKLIQGSRNGILDIIQSLNVHLEPNLCIVGHTILDTLPGDDGDGRVDAGEIIQVYLTVKNAGEDVDSVWSRIQLGEFEDASVAKVIKDLSFIGSIGTYATLSGDRDPMVIQISPDVVHNRDIVFDVFVWCSGIQDTIKKEIIFTVDHGFELSGLVSDTLTLTPDKHWIITGSFKIAPNGVLNILPGTELTIDSKLINDGKIIAIGKKDSLIKITGTTIRSSEHGHEGYLHISNSIISLNYQVGCIFGQTGIIENSRIELKSSGGSGVGWKWTAMLFKDCELRDCNARYLFYDHPDTLYRCNIDNCKYGSDKHTALFESSCYLIYNNFSRCGPLNYANDSPPIFIGPNNLLDSGLDNYNKVICYATKGSYWDYYDEIQNQYWGTSDSSHIEEKIYDFLEDPEFSRIIFKPYLKKPTPLAHGCVWKVEIDGIDPQDEHLDPIGSGTYRFDVYFNRAMDTSYTPLLTFGVREPYTQHIVKDSTHWSPDSTIWTAYYTVGLETGDGIQTIRVANARDNEGFEIPVENSRFKFIIQAAGATATEFIATPGIGKVDLAWPVADIPDLLGYNMYRFQKLTDSTYTDTIMINSELITDSIYTDYDVIPDTTYYYLYTVVGTDMKESDFSKAVAATPFNAPPGDANGDLSINILDITTIVSYLLKQNPQPFIFDAADVNEDGQVNVLDIVAVVNIVMGNGQAPKITCSQKSDRRMVFSKNDIRIENARDISALQLVGVGKNLSMDYIYPGKLLKRMEYAFNVKNDTFYLVVYNLKNAGFSENSGELFTLSKGEIKEVTSVQIADGNGQLLDIKVISSEKMIPKEYALLQNYPNPFNPTTTIRYALPECKDVKIEIFNILGQKIYTFEFKNQSPGYHRVIWNGRNQNNCPVSSGLYIYRIKAGNFIASKKMLLIR